MENGGLIYRGYIKSLKITRRGALEMGWEFYISQMKALTIFYPENSPFLQEKTRSNPPFARYVLGKNCVMRVAKEKHEIMTKLLRKQLCFFFTSTNAAGLSLKLGHLDSFPLPLSNLGTIFAPQNTVCTFWLSRANPWKPQQPEITGLGCSK